MTSTETSSGLIATFRFYDEDHLEEFRAEHVDRPCSDLMESATLRELDDVVQRIDAAIVTDPQTGSDYADVDVLRELVRSLVPDFYGPVGS